MSYKILSIDGGGIKGVFPISFLASLEENLSEPIGSYFDLIAGTSTGGIIALALGLGIRASDLLKFYLSLGDKIFQGNKICRFLRQFVFSKYDSKHLKEALESVFKDKKIGHSKTRLFIPTLNCDTGEVHIYKTAHHKKLVYDYKEKAVNVALATGAAPTYFPKFTTNVGIPLIDGGLWANNPIGFAVIEAITTLGWPRDNLKVLSIGCTMTPFNLGFAKMYDLGFFSWGTKVADTFMSGQCSSSLGTAKLLAGHENIYRVNPVVTYGRFALDSVKELNSLNGLGASNARHEWPVLSPIFFSQYATEFIPYCSVS